MSSKVFLALSLLAALAVPALAGPPEAVPGKMVLEGEVRRDLRLRLTSGTEVLLQKTAAGVVVGRPGCRVFSPRAFVDRVRGVLVLEGTAMNPVTICTQRGDHATLIRMEEYLAP
jgi:hypothetical protein